MARLQDTSEESRIGVTRISACVQSLLSQLFDYAGLFPPAALSMKSAVNSYLEHRRGEHAWILGRFVVPTSRLQELVAELEAAGASVDAPIALSLLSPDWDRERDTISSFIAQHSPLISLAAIEQQGSVSRRHLEPIYLEMPVDEELPQRMQQASDIGCGVKLRTGGLTPEGFPTAAQVACFVAAARQFRLPMKATAGLHHPLPRTRPASAASDAPRVPMHGFLNVLMASLLAARDDCALADLVQTLNEPDTASFELKTEGICYRNFSFSLAEIQTMRSSLFQAIGSCSLDEPIAGLQAIGWLGNSQ